MAISSLNSDWNASYGNQMVSFGSPAATYGYAAPSLTPSVPTGVPAGGIVPGSYGSGGGSSPSLSGGGSSRPSLVPTASGGGGSSVPQWKKNLGIYASNPSLGYDEIDRAGQVYNQKIAAGDIESANAAHLWANQIRDAMGVSNYYDRLSGGQTAQDPLRMSLIPSVPKEQPVFDERRLMPPVPKYDRGGYTPVPAPYPSLKLSSGTETIIPTMDYVNKQYGLQNDMAKRIYDQNMYDYNMKQYERQKMADEAKRINDEAQLEIDRKKADAAMITANRPYSTGASGGLTRPTQTDRRNEATASAFQWVNELANSGRGMQTALKLFRDNIAEFTKDGADIGAVENFIYQVFTGQDKSKDNPIYLINSPSFGD